MSPPASAPAWRWRAGRAYVFAGNDLFLQANERVYQPGDDVEIDLRGGTPGAWGMIVSIECNGTPTFAPIWVGKFGPFGTLAYRDVATAADSGLTVKVIGYAQGAGGGLLDSIAETITFE